MLSQRRRHSRWRMFLVLLMFVGLIRHSELTSAGIPESSSLGSAPAARKKSQDLGSLSDFSWQAWFMVDTQAGAQPGMDSATLLRRITPKSIFIAPVLPACPDGYQEDAMERCVKSVNLDENAHFSFLLQRLNTLYANQKASPQSKQPTGPLQLNIPLMPSSNSESKPETIETLSQNDPLAAVVDDIGLADDKKHEATATVYEVKNHTALGDDKQKDEEEESLSTFFHENRRRVNVDKSEQKPDAAVPVAEIVETNDTSFSGVVDYKIPTDLKTLSNASSAKRFNASDIGNEDPSTTDKLINVTEISPIMKLLSSTIIPSTTARPKMDNLSLAENNTVNHAIGLTSDHTSHAFAKEITNDNASDSYGLPPMWKLSEMDKRRDNETRTEDKPKEDLKLDEPHETDFLYDEEEDDEYMYSTDVPDEESTEMEGEEILKHGEAGMTIPTQKPGLLHREQQRLQLQQQQNQTADPKATSARDQVVIRFNESTPTDKDEVETNVSSEVSIDGDLILETTLLDVNTEKLQVTSTQSPDGEIATKSNDNDDSRESYSQDHGTSAPEVVFSPRESHGTAFTGTLEHDQAEHSTRVDTPVEDDRRDDTLETALPSSESLLYDLPEQDRITESHTIDEERLNVSKESVLEDNTKRADTTPRNTRSDSFVRFEDLERVPASHEHLEDYVRFPSSPVRQSQQRAYVRFPSNSIHRPNYKHHSHQASNDGAYGSTSTKSSVPISQKPVYHLPARSWKPDRQQDQRAAAAAAMATIAQRQKQTSPTLLRLWNKMPLIRNPPIFPVDQFPTNRSGDDDLLEGGPPAGRRLHRSYLLSRSRRTNKALMRQRRRTPISG
ncbi:uncharacterized protein LOC116852629 [Odontomachus brunneus]|uniref:uncharacterized protein LOC116852629 n=1 Tax=Odontomachus brunneus TaxID=486640 RepID=UPI0013F1C095|nr:uncharacterized protein LOC116852629 [Odontomachus brunneus]XP_032689064.1 uncharacterized protein LOC116852629 [Odontomachus brunneus]